MAAPRKKPPSSAKGQPISVEFEPLSVEERYRLLVENARDYAIIGLDPNGNVFEWNQGAQSVFGYSAEEITGQNFSLFFRPEDRENGVPEKELEKALKTGRADDERWHVRAEGRLFYASGVTTCLFDAQGRPRGFAKVCRDLTERKLAETEQERLVGELQAAQEAALQLAQLQNRLLTNITHEFRTPLTTIIGYSEMLEEELRETGSERAAADASHVRAAAKRLLSMINEILDLSDIETGRMTLHYEGVDVAEMAVDLVNAITPLAESHGSTVSLSGQENAGIMYADELRVRQILLNLLSNAARHTRDGTIRLECSRTEENGREWLTFRVIDTGPGLSEDAKKALFAPFSQLTQMPDHRDQGTGLGLAISRRSCEMMGGELTVESSSGEGTIFRIRLPADRRGH